MYYKVSNKKSRFGVKLFTVSQDGGLSDVWQLLHETVFSRFTGNPEKSVEPVVPEISRGLKGIRMEG